MNKPLYCKLSESIDERNTCSDLTTLESMYQNLENLLESSGVDDELFQEIILMNLIGLTSCFNCYTNRGIITNGFEEKINKIKQLTANKLLIDYSLIDDLTTMYDKDISLINEQVYNLIGNTTKKQTSLPADARELLKQLI